MRSASRKKRRTNAGRISKTETLRRALLELLAEHRRDDMLPTSGRFLFYELVTQGIISKHPTGKRRADQDMIDALTDLRESGQVPWNWIVDETRSLDDYTGAGSIRDWVLEQLEFARLAPWEANPPLVLTESRSLAGVLRNLAYEFAIRIAPTNGQTAGFLHTKVAPRVHARTRVLYLGDYDLAGNDIEANSRRVLEEVVDCELDWRRVALTRQQVDLYNLPIIQKTDRRFNDGGVHDAVETEALSQALIVQILHDELESMLPEPLETVLEREDHQRALIRQQFGR
jgi:hypothetical protein